MRQSEIEIRLSDIMSLLKEHREGYYDIKRDIDIIINYLGVKFEDVPPRRILVKKDENK